MPTSKEPDTTPLTAGIQSSPVSFSHPIPYSRLKNLVVLITGGASGIGAALSIQLAAHGAHIIVADIDTNRGEDLVAKLRRSSGSPNHHFVHVDVADWASQVALFRAAISLSPTGGIDAVVAGAGIAESSESEALEQLAGPMTALVDSETVPPAPKLRTLNVDLIGTLYTTQLALAYLGANPGSSRCSTSTSKGERDRHLLLVSSIAGLAALSAASVYAAAKHGVVGLFRSLRLTAPVVHGVRVNLLAPQYVPTPMHGVRGASMLVGVPKTLMGDAVDAALRLLATDSIIGRGLLVGTRAEPELIEKAGLEGKDDAGDTGNGGAIRDIYAHDFVHADLLMRRTIALLNLVTKVRTWAETGQDVARLLLVVFAALWGALCSLLGLRPARRAKSR